VKRRAADPELLKQCGKVAMNIPPHEYSPQVGRERARKRDREREKE